MCSIFLDIEHEEGIIIKMFSRNYNLNKTWTVCWLKKQTRKVGTKQEKM